MPYKNRISQAQLMNQKNAKIILKRGFKILILFIHLAIIKTAINIIALSTKQKQGYFGLLTFIDLFYLIFYFSLLVQIYYREYRQIDQNDKKKYVVKTYDFMNLYTMINSYGNDTKSKVTVFLLFRILNIVTLIYGSVLYYRIEDQFVLGNNIQIIKVDYLFILTQIFGYGELFIHLISSLINYTSERLRVYKEIDLRDPCSICLISYIADDQIVQLHCDHVYHFECIKRWISNKQQCPICRVTIE